MCSVCVFFFKQKTAYEMRISDWSSDVCSSDLLHSVSERFRELGKSADEFSLPMSREDIASYLGMVIETVSRTFSRFQDDGIISVRGRQIGRASCRERVCQYV